MSLQAIRGTLMDFLHDPGEGLDGMRSFADGVLVMDRGHVVQIGPAEKILAQFPSSSVVHYPDCLILPGFIDTHTHFSQTEMIASFGEELLQWLGKYTFPTEATFADPSHAEHIACVFLDELLRHGTTTALVFTTTHAHSVELLFGQALRRNMRLIAGKVIMDRQAPQELCDAPENAYEVCSAQIRQWHGKGRLQYAVMPRYALACSREELAMTKRLQAEHPDVYLHTHLAENKAETELVAREFPERKNYLDVYDHYGMVTARSIFAHGIYLSDEEQQLLVKKKAALAHCPSANLFLGSGLFPLQRVLAKGVKVGLGTDIGAGTSFSLLRMMHESYKVAALQGYALSGPRAFYLATLGGAVALNLHDKIGNFEVGKEADCVVLNPLATPLQSLRYQKAKTLADKLFCLMMLGDDRNVLATYVAGRKVWDSKRFSF